jgi:hypothetical protein
MSVFVMEFDDRALALARGGRVLTVAPSTVFDGTGGGSAGANAWRELRMRPMSTSSRHLGSVLAQQMPSIRAQQILAAELRTRLAEQPISAGEHVWIATPARVEPEGLEVLLAVAREIEVPVDGLVDSATAAAASLSPDGNAIVLELGLHHVAATAIDREGGQARRRRTVPATRGGLLDLQQAWLDLIGKAMVRRTRFDPLHDAATEQQLFDAMHTLTEEVARDGVTTAVVTRGRERFEVPLTRDQFAQAAEPVYQSILALLHQLRPAGSSVDIVLPVQVLSLPGLRQRLDEFVGCNLVGLPDGFAAAAVSLLDLPPSPRDQSAVRMLRRLPLQQLTEVQALATHEELGRRRSGGPAPSHALLDGKAYSLSSEALVVGRTPLPGGVELPDGLAGVSRRHCTFAREGDTA